MTVLGNVSVNSNFNVTGIAGFSNEIICYDKIRLSRNKCDWLVYTESNRYNNNYSDIIFQSANNTRVSFTDDFDPGTFNFTGSHRCSYTSEMFNYEDDNKENLIGKIVVSTGTYNNLENETIIDINEAVPVVELAQNNNDKRVFGVIAGFEELNTSNRSFKLGNIRFNKKKSLEDIKIVVNAVGEGGIWVCNANGVLKNGDLITSGNVNGYGIKQDSDLLTSYTVAKITCDCSFDLHSKIYKCEKFKYHDKEYLRAFVGCVYKC